MSKGRNRVVTWIVLAALGIVMLGSSAFIIIHAEHDCTGEECAVCAALAECIRTLDNMGSACAGAVQTVLTCCLTAAVCIIIIKLCYAHTTLISLKVELLD
ncbi:hypothetical protein [uncultured Ruminococcus sp.]|uniref:hypothetical protein n=1 Tax=uncultured Ruminococcus sp. TaxID=165186 RepID=UPI0025EBF8B7|nr:hypothetical protein [uncultured Ruminococcus sp.]